MGETPKPPLVTRSPHFYGLSGLQIITTDAVSAMMPETEDHPEEIGVWVIDGKIYAHPDVVSAIVNSLSAEAPHG